MFLKKKDFLDLLRLSMNCEELAIEKLIQQGNLTQQLFHEIVQDLSESLKENLEIKENLIHISKKKKMNLVNKAIRSGVELDQIIENLHWREFENLCLIVFDKNDFRTFQNFYFTQNKKRYEIDVIAIQEPLIFTLDAKKWKTGRSSALKIMVKKQINRVKAFSKSLHKRKIRQKLQLKNWRSAKIIPIIVTSKMYDIKIFQKVPILPFFKLNQFINEFHCYLDMIQLFSVNFSIQKTLFPK